MKDSSEAKSSQWADLQEIIWLSTSFRLRNDQNRSTIINEQLHCMVRDLERTPALEESRKKVWGRGMWMDLLNGKSVMLFESQEQLTKGHPLQRRLSIRGTK